MNAGNRQRLLDAVGDAILVDRAATHGSPEDSFFRIKGMWESYLYYKYRWEDALTESDVAIMLTLLKIARSMGNPEYLDNYIDGAGYMLLAGDNYAD